MVVDVDGEDVEVVDGELSGLVVEVELLVLLGVVLEVELLALVVEVESAEGVDTVELVPGSSSVESVEIVDDVFPAGLVASEVSVRLVAAAVVDEAMGRSVTWAPTRLMAEYVTAIITAVAPIQMEMSNPRFFMSLLSLTGPFVDAIARLKIR